MSKNTILNNQSSTIGKIKFKKKSPVRVLNEDSSELFKKKLLKGKLVKLINDSIIKMTDYNETIEDQSTSIKSNVTHNPKKNFSTNFYPNIIGKDLKYTSVSNDYYVTPHELVSKNFNPSQIQLISSNPMYFKLPENFLEIELFKKRKLIDVLEREEKINLPVLKEKFQSEDIEINKKKKIRNRDNLRTIFPSIDISLIGKNDTKRQEVKNYSDQVNKLFLTKDLSRCLSTNRKYNINISSISSLEKLNKYESNRNNLLKQTSRKFQMENAKVDEHREKLFQSRVKQDEEDQLILKYNGKILQNYKNKKKNCK